MAVRLTVEHEKEVIGVPWKVVATDNGDGSVDISVESSDERDSWSLFKLKADGTFYRHTYIGSDSGFNLTTKGQIVESKVED